jgi:GNAT superfamily N-acetyltransferase
MTAGADSDTRDLPAPCREGQLSDGTPYTVRQFEASDRAAVRELYTTISGTEPAPGWLEWKFREAPAGPDGGMFVAESPDGILGIRPFLPLEMRFGTRRVDATCFVNAMVHPTAQGEGVFTPLTDCAIEYLTDRTDLVFLFANGNSRPIYERWGWTEVTTTTPHYRFWNPGALLPGDRTWTRVAGELLSVGARSYLAARRLLTDDSGDVSVTRVDDVPAGRLASLYRRAVPETLHVVRDEAFYRWRLGGPDRSWTVYVATRDGRDVGALVTRPQPMRGRATRIDVSDAVPLEGPQREPVCGALLDRLVADNPDVDVLAVPGTAIPSDVLESRGFLSSARPPLSWLYARLYDPLTLFAYPQTDLGFDVGDVDNWEVCDLMRNTN